MVVSIFNYITIAFNVGSFTISLLVLSALIKRYKQTQITALLILSIAIICSCASELLEFLAGILLFDQLAELYFSMFGAIFTLLGLYTAIIFLLFIDYFEKEGFALRHVVVASIVGSAETIGTGILIGTLNANLNLAPGYDLIYLLTIVGLSFVTPVFLIYVLISSIKTINRVKAYALDSVQLRQLFLLKNALVCYFLVTTISFVIGNMLIARANPSEVVLIFFAIIPRAGVIIGSILLWYSYASSTRAAFLQPQRMYRLLVINKAGLPLFSYDFLPTEQLDSVLLSGGITAIGSLLKEAVGTASDVVAIKFSDKQIMISNHKTFGVFLITDRPSNFLHKAIKTFGVQFDLKYGSLVEEVLDLSTYTDAAIIIRKEFGLS